jgi:N-acetylglutamate synthase/N-acetylornithine aminotransferase
MAKETDRLFIPKEDKLECEVLVMSTGVIGVNLDIGKGIRSCAPNSLSKTSKLGVDFSS